MVLPVKVTLDAVNHLAHTIDITHTGHASAASERNWNLERS